MAAVTEDSPLGPYLTTLIEQSLVQFARRNARVPGSPVVHGMVPAPFFGVRVPGLACHTAVGGWDWMRLRPAVGPVTCHHCLRVLGLVTASGMVGEQLVIRFPATL